MKREPTEDLDWDQSKQNWKPKYRIFHEPFGSTWRPGVIPLHEELPDVMLEQDLISKSSEHADGFVPQQSPKAEVSVAHAALGVVGLLPLTHICGLAM